jgi:hypothetical protein
VLEHLQSRVRWLSCTFKIPDSSQFSASFTETALMIKKLVIAALVIISDPFSATMHKLSQNFTWRYRTTEYAKKKRGVGGI